MDLYVFDEFQSTAQLKSLASGKLFKVLPEFFWHDPVAFDNFLLTLCQDVPNSWIFPAADLELAIYPRNPGLAQWDMSFEDQIWVLELFTAIGSILFLNPFSGKSWNKQIPHEFVLIFLIQIYIYRVFT